MGFEVRVVATLRKPPTEALMTALDHHFGSASHQAGTRTVELTEHVAMSSETDAAAFVRTLVLELLPPGSEISVLTATTD